MDAAALGALFFLAMATSALAGGTDITAGSNAVTALFESAGVGALLALVGQAVWEVVFPYVPDRGVHSWFAWSRWLDRRRELYRIEIAKECLGFGGVTPPPFPVMDKGHKLDAYHEQVIAVERVFYSLAPASIVEWCRRRYQRFVMALSASTALILGIVVGLAIPGPQASFVMKGVIDIALLVVVSITMLWAVEVRHHAQAMEASWFAAWHLVKDRVDPTLIAFTQPGGQAGEAAGLKPASPLTVVLSGAPDDRSR